MQLGHAALLLKTRDQDDRRRRIYPRTSEWWRLLHDTGNKHLRMPEFGGVCRRPRSSSASYSGGQPCVRFCSCAGVSVRGPSATSAGIGAGSAEGSFQQSTVPRLWVQYGGGSGGGSIGLQ